MTTDTKPLAKRLRHVRFRAEEGAGSRPAKESVKVRPTDWHSVCDGLTEAADALDAKDALLREAAEVLTRVANAEALAGVRGLVAGWNGENRPEGPYTEKHPSRLGATLPKTTCGAVYELDDALQGARTLLSKLTEVTKP